MSNTSISLVNLDFDSLKDDFKTYLQSQTAFKDYDYDGSNINVLLDLLAYNTYLNSFYLNMVANESFLDTAQLRDSIISRVKELNYVPRSFVSSRALVYLEIKNVNKPTITMPKGTSFTGTIDTENFNFVTDENIVIVGDGASTTFMSEPFYIYEGQIVTDTFTVSNIDQTFGTVDENVRKNPTFQLSNPTIDTSSLTVLVYEDDGSVIIPYKRTNTLLDKNSESLIYFLQASDNEKYEIVFGDGVLGRKPKNGAQIFAEYRATKGELPNGTRLFKNNAPIDGLSDVTVYTSKSASLGSVSEDIESIRYNAPRAFNTQERAITAEDYKNILMTNFPEINTMVAYGGEDVYPPQYGKVFLSIDLKQVDSLPSSKRDIYYDFLKGRAALSLDIEFVDPEYMYLDIETNVKYNLNLTQLNNSSISKLVLDTITNFNTTYLDDFDLWFRYSKFISDIDESDISIISNDTTVRVYKQLLPEFAKFFNYDLNFNQKLRNDFSNKEDIHPVNYISCLSSNKFIYEGILVELEDDGVGNILIIREEGANHVEIRNVGTVDYETGRIKLNNIKIDAIPNSRYLKIYARTKEKDIRSSLNNILSIKPEDISINAEAQRD